MQQKANIIDDPDPCNTAYDLDDQLDDEQKYTELIISISSSEKSHAFLPFIAACAISFVLLQLHRRHFDESSAYVHQYLPDPPHTG